VAPHRSRPHLDEAWLIEQLTRPGGCRLLQGALVQPLPSAAPEKDLQSEVQTLCTHLGYLHYHTLKSKGSTAGFPDSLIVRPEGGTLWALELKRTGQHPSPAQRRWLEALAQVTRVHAATYSPAEWPRIVELLTRQDTP
jgi:hypothetical protein